MTPQTRLKTESHVLPIAALDALQRDEMHALLSAHFDGVTREQFESDLSEKNRVILLTRGNQLAGFSTLLAYETTFEGEKLNVIYSGDTIVTPEAWGTTTLPRAWIAAVNRVLSSMSGRRSYWLLLTSGFRTYRFLPLFWREFWPRSTEKTPPKMDELLHFLARERFGNQFDAKAGIVRFSHPQRLQPGLNEIPGERLSDPDIAFFAGRNPGHAQGDELVCITELSPENLTAAGRRMVGEKEQI